ncbi:MBL fold metallo-hydrolase [Anaerovorax odorimutans]|uniref:MBL fold metallo-hydrolase n=1 Tax=Anaerovorax odorimutans TaxID=109327 RepID=A0ABT1RNY4_9FIRM|nr:MBL fold metallo-hydrolase [Anaerovorax odorimutans]MCQ4636885.1 MBL fold metallo-hydrolase [Anaerovorax odorimutans]
MALNFCSFASGSSGNCYMVRHDDTVILVDVGISGKRIFEGLEQAGAEPEQVRAVLITHEHIDHVKSLPIVTKKACNAKAYANEATWSNIERKVAEDKKAFFTTGEDFYIEDILIRPFSIPHDAAEPVGFSLYAEGRQISILTDAGCITEEIFDEIVDADLLVLEANHEVEVLKMCGYPYQTKRRILGDHGHLSNVTAGKCICKLMEVKDKARRVLLGHLSHQNNEPELAKMTITNILQEEDIYIGDRLQMEVMLRDCVSAVYEV